MKYSRSLIIVLTAFVSPIATLSATSVPDDWVEVHNSGLVTERNITEYLSGKQTFDVSESSISTSSKFFEKDDAVILENYEDNVENQWVKYENVEYVEPGKNIKVDVKISIVDASVYPEYGDSQTNKEYIKFNEKFDIYQYGYQVVDYRVEFYEAGTNRKIKVNPVLEVSDIDLDQTFTANAKKESAFVSTHSKLETKSDGDNIAFTASQEADSLDSNRAVYAFNNTSSIDFSIGMNRGQVEYDEEQVYGSLNMNFYSGVSTEGIVASSTGNIELMSVDENGSPLRNAGFEVKSEENKNVYHIETNSKGYAELENLPYGQYTVVQEYAPPGYVLDNTKYVVDVKTSTRSSKVNSGDPIINSVITGTAKVKVVDESGLAVKGVEFVVEDELDNKVQTIVTNKNGEATTDLLEYGNYSLYETKSPSGFELDPSIYHFSIVSNNQEVVVVQPLVVNAIIDNDKQFETSEGGYVEIRKYGAKPGEQYEIYDENGELLQTLTLDGNGYAISERLKLGNYTLVGPEGSYSFSIEKGKLIQRYMFEAEENPGVDQKKYTSDVSLVESVGGNEGSSTSKISTNVNYDYPIEGYMEADNQLSGTAVDAGSYLSTVIIALSSILTILYYIKHRAT